MQVFGLSIFYNLLELKSKLKSTHHIFIVCENML